MEPPYGYDEDLYDYLGDCEQDSGSPSEQGAAVAAGGIASEDHPSQVNSENQQGKLEDHYVSSDNDLDPEGDQGDEEATEADPEEPAWPLAVTAKRQGRRHQIPFCFTQWQVQEMECVFQETEYRDVLTRRVLASRMNVPEAKVQMWFNNRRAKQRASEKKALLRSTPGGIHDLICMMDPEEPSGTTPPGASWR